MIVSLDYLYSISKDLTPYPYFIGCLSKQDTPTLTIDEMNKISAQGWAGDK